MALLDDLRKAGAQSAGTTSADSGGAGQPKEIPVDPSRSYTYFRDTESGEVRARDWDGNLVLDEHGDPLVITTGELPANITVDYDELEAEEAAENLRAKRLANDKAELDIGRQQGEKDLAAENLRAKRLANEKAEQDLGRQQETAGAEAFQNRYNQAMAKYNATLAAYNPVNPARDRSIIKSSAGNVVPGSMIARLNLERDLGTARPDPWTGWGVERQASRPVHTSIRGRDGTVFHSEVGGGGAPRYWSVGPDGRRRSYTDNDQMSAREQINAAIAENNKKDAKNKKDAARRKGAQLSGHYDKDGNFVWENLTPEGAMAEYKRVMAEDERRLSLAQARVRDLQRQGGLETDYGSDYGSDEKTRAAEQEVYKRELAAAKQDAVGISEASDKKRLEWLRQGEGRDAVDWNNATRTPVLASSKARRNLRKIQSGKGGLIYADERVTDLI